MSVKVFKTNKANKIEFTCTELEKLLNEIYNEGYNDGERHARNSYWTWTTPVRTNVFDPYYLNTISTTGTTSTLSAATPLGCSSNNKTDGTLDLNSAATSNSTPIINKIKIETHGEKNNDKVNATAAASFNDSPVKTYAIDFDSSYTSADVSKIINSVLRNIHNIEASSITNDVFTNLKKEALGL